MVSHEKYGSVECFHPRQIWLSPAGNYYRVLEVRRGGGGEARAREGWIGEEGHP